MGARLIGQPPGALLAPRMCQPLYGSRAAQLARLARPPEKSMSEMCEGGSSSTQHHPSAKSPPNPSPSARSSTQSCWMDQNERENRPEMVHLARLAPVHATWAKTCLEAPPSTFPIHAACSSHFVCNPRQKPTRSLPTRRATDCLVKQQAKAPSAGKAKHPTPRLPYD